MSGTLSNTDPLAVPAARPLAGLTPKGWLGWGVFLGMSWTWCIGMFLPYLLIRDYGWLVWVVFAVPNVLGAAAMGWTIRSPESSLRIARAHRAAGRVFSAVTIAFHLFFVFAVMAPFGLSVVGREQALNAAMGCTLGAAVLLYLYMTGRRGGERVAAWGVFFVSLAAMIFGIAEIFAITDPLVALRAEPSADLLSLAPVCVFGFLFCPYLDLTFHRARQRSTRPRASFGLGFGFFFLLMIVFTLVYSTALIVPYGINGWIVIFLFVHMVGQVGFTVAAHARELRHHSIWPAALAVVLTLGAWGAHMTLPNGEFYHGLRAGEIIYRCFMGFYGLVFPAYVWLVMIPAGGERPGARALICFALAVLMAGPMFFAGFIAQQMIWLLPGLGIVLLARLAVPAQRPAA